MSTNRLEAYFSGMVDASRPATKKPKAKKPTELQVRQGIALRKALDALKLSGRAFAELIGTTESRVSQMLKGVSFPDTLADVKPIAQWAGASAKAMLAGEYKQDPYWFPIRSMSFDEKLRALMAHPGANRKILWDVDVYYGQLFRTSD